MSYVDRQCCLKKRPVTLARLRDLPTSYRGHEQSTLVLGACRTSLRGITKLCLSGMLSTMKEDDCCLSEDATHTVACVDIRRKRIWIHRLGIRCRKELLRGCQYVMLCNVVLRSEHELWQRLGGEVANLAKCEVVLKSEILYVAEWHEKKKSACIVLGVSTMVQGYHVRCVVDTDVVC